MTGMINGKGWPLFDVIIAFETLDLENLAVIAQDKHLKY